MLTEHQLAALEEQFASSTPEERRELARYYEGLSHLAPEDPEPVAPRAAPQRRNRTAELEVRRLRARVQELEDAIESSDGRVRTVETIREVRVSDGTLTWNDAAELVHAVVAAGLARVVGDEPETLAEPYQHQGAGVVQLTPGERRLMNQRKAAHARACKPVGRGKGHVSIAARDRAQAELEALDG